jgi:hypothetical protein
MDRMTGRCFCRAITFEVTGPPRMVVHCHCESCRRSTSSPVATFLIVNKTDFKYTRGEPKVFASSPGVKRSFCGRCGSPLAYETEQRPKHTDLYVATLDDPSAVVPQSHVHVQEQLPWFDILDDKPRYLVTGREGGPIRHGPRPMP